ncbi:hypothetical protein ACOME3_006312 [Neoechinorhynchus agilis]
MASEVDSQDVQNDPVVYLLEDLQTAHQSLLEEASNTFENRFEQFKSVFVSILNLKSELEAIHSASENYVNELHERQREAKAHMMTLMNSLFGGECD